MDFKGKEVFKGENMAEMAQKSKELSSSIKLKMPSKRFYSEVQMWRFIENESSKELIFRTCGLYKVIPLGFGKI